MSKLFFLLGDGGGYLSEVEVHGEDERGELGGGVGLGGGGDGGEDGGGYLSGKDGGGGDGGSEKIFLEFKSSYSKAVNATKKSDHDL